jgi:hypothetical protein
MAQVDPLPALPATSTIDGTPADLARSAENPQSFDRGSLNFAGRRNKSASYRVAHD